MTRSAALSPFPWTAADAPAERRQILQALHQGQDAEKYLAEQMALARRDLDYLESVLEELSRAETEQDFLDIRGELRDAGFLRRQGKKEQNRPAKPLEFRTTSGLPGAGGAEQPPERQADPQRGPPGHLAPYPEDPRFPRDPLHRRP